MLKIDHLKIIWSSFSNKALKFGQILMQKLLGFIKNETNGKIDVQIRFHKELKNETNGQVDVQIKEFYGFDMKQHLVRSREPRDFWSVLRKKK